MRGKVDMDRAEELASQLFLNLDKNKNAYLTEKEFVQGIKNNTDITNMLGPSSS